jgi:hypothetical protein
VPRYTNSVTLSYVTPFMVVPFIDLRDGKNKLCLFFKGKYLEEYMVLNMKMGKGKIGRIEN